MAIMKQAAQSQAERALTAFRKLGWRLPSILLTLGSFEVVESETVSTAGVYLLGKKHGFKARILINPKWAAPLTPAQLAGVILHEILHVLDEHFPRRGVRLQMLWNMAGDYRINGYVEAMKEYAPGLVDLPSGCLKPTEEMMKQTVEEIYDCLLKDKPKPPPPPPPGDDEDPGKGKGEGPGDPSDPGKGEGPGNPAPDFGDDFGKGCGPQKDPEWNGDSPWADGDGEKDDEESRQHWRAVKVQANSLGRGTVAGKAFSDLLADPPARVKWGILMRRIVQESAASHRRDDLSYRRRSRRSTPDVILPGWIGFKPRIGVMIDTSGSMSDETLEQAVSEIISIQKQLACEIYLVAADTRVTWEGWLKEADPKNISKAREAAGSGRGGTDFAPAYEAIGKVKGRFDALVHMTDGQAYWPDPLLPKNSGRLVIALMGSVYKADLPSHPKCRVIDVEV